MNPTSTTNRLLWFSQITYTDQKLNLWPDRFEPPESEILKKVLIFSQILLDALYGYGICLEID